jgi:hypothetical protein
MKIAITVPAWIIAELGEQRCCKIARDVIDECIRANLSKTEAIGAALLALDAVAGTSSDGARLHAA